MKYLILTWSLLFSQLAMSYPIGFKSVGGTTKYPAVVNVPSGHLSTISGGILLDSGDGNLLLDPNMEDTSTAAWTCTVGTCTKTTTAGEFSEGAQALKVALSAQAMNVSQSVSTVSGSSTQHVVGVNYRVPATMADFQICTLIAGAEKTCVPSANLILDDTYHTIEIPEVITPGSTVGIKFKTTSTYTANAFFDKAYIKQGIGTQALQLDNVYSATVSSTGVISNLNKTGWLSGNCSVSATSTFDCPIATGLVTQKMNCVATPSGNSTSYIYIPAYDSAASTSSNAKFYTTNSTNAVATAVPFIIHCQKAGNDYLASSAAVYSQASADFGGTAVTMTGSWTTNTSYTAFVKRIGDRAYFEGFVLLSGAPDAAGLSLNLPSGYVIDSTKLPAINLRASYGINKVYDSSAGTLAAEGQVRGSSTTSVILDYVDATSGAQASYSNVAPLTFATGDSIYFKFDVPIVGWSNSEQIIGSFAGYTNVPGYQGRVDSFSLSYGGATSSTVCSSNPCTIYNQIGTGVSTLSWSSAGAMTMNFSKAYSSLNCVVRSSNGGTSLTESYTPLTASNASSLQFTTMINTGAATNSYGTIMCQGTY